jgi:membrane protease YdiL (CAAX protease family)
MRHRPVAAFLATVYGLSWILFLPPLLSRSGIGVLPFTLPPQPSILVLSVFGMTLAAFGVTRAADGPDGVRVLRHRYTRWRIGAGWYLLAIFGPLLACLLGATLWLGWGPPRALVERPGLLLTAYLPQTVSIALLINLWEEGGWTGFLFPRLQERWGPLRGGAMVSVCQGLAHLPLLFIVGGVSDTRIAPGDIWKYLVFLLVLQQPVRVVAVWIWNRTRGSVPILGFLHAAVNATTSAAVIPKLAPGHDPLWVYAVYAVVAVPVIALTRGRLGYRPVGEARR